jgi:hypothetical protein
MVDVHLDFTDPRRLPFVGSSDPTGLPLELRHLQLIAELAQDP